MWCCGGAPFCYEASDWIVFFSYQYLNYFVSSHRIRNFLQKLNLAQFISTLIRLLAGTDRAAVVVRGILGKSN